MCLSNTPYILSLYKFNYIIVDSINLLYIFEGWGYLDQQDVTLQELIYLVEFIALTYPDTFFCWFHGLGYRPQLIL